MCLGFLFRELRDNLTFRWLRSKEINRPRALKWQRSVVAPTRMGVPIWCHLLSASILSTTRATKAWPHSQGDRHPPWLIYVVLWSSFRFWIPRPARDVGLLLNFSRVAKKVVKSRQTPRNKLGGSSSKSSSLFFQESFLLIHCKLGSLFQDYFWPVHCLTWWSIPWWLCYSSGIFFFSFLLSQSF